MALVPQLCFLGVCISSNGAVFLWHPLGTSTHLVHNVIARLSHVGMSTYPAAITCALGVAVLPAILYGVELWAARDPLRMVRHGAFPYQATCFTPVLYALKCLAGLPSTAISAPVYCLFQLSTVFESVPPRKVCLLSTLFLPVL